VIRLWKLLKKKGGEKTGVEDALQKKYKAFISLLAGNEHCLDLMTELENKLYNHQLISLPYLKAMVKNLSRSVSNVVFNLTDIANGGHAELTDIFGKIEADIRSILTGKKEPLYTPVIIPMDKISTEYIDKVGSKMANLGELRKRCGLMTPDGFALTACAYTHFSEYNGLDVAISRILRKTDITKSANLISAEKEIKALVKNALVPPEIESIVRAQSRKLEEEKGRPVFWAVRSSAIGEDMENSFAGQFSTVLNVPTDELLEKYKAVVASKYNARSMLYQRMKRIRPEDVNMSVGFIEMIRPVCSGVLYTTDPVLPDRHEIVISAVWGLGQLLVEGKVEADSYVLKRKPGFPVVRREIGRKEICLNRLEGGGIEHEIVSDSRMNRPCLTGSQLAALGKMALTVEAHFKYPQDIEWCIDEQDRIYVLQARSLHLPDRTLHTPSPEKVDAPVVAEKGRPVAAGVGSGKVFKVTDIHELFRFPEGGVLVIRNSSPQFIGALQKAAAVVVEKGNPTDHLSSVVREFKVPCLVRIPGIFSELRSGQEITVDAIRGIIYDGRVSELLNVNVNTRPIVVDVAQTESYQLLARIADFIFPLNLTDPRVGDFSENACRTFHDLIRFCHETALNEMFSLKERAGIKGVRNIYRVITNLPFNLSVLDLFGDTRTEPASSKKAVLPEAIVSRPFQALWRGMSAPDVSWQGQVAGMNAGNLLSAMMRTPSFEISSDDVRSFAVITPQYLNLSLSMGYHYVVLDSYLSDDPYNNYITLSFKGGAADARKRELRVMFIAKIVKRDGFDVMVKKDFLSARIKAEDAETLDEKLYTLGRLMGVTRLADFAMEDESSVDRMIDEFFGQDNVNQGTQL